MVTAKNIVTSVFIFVFISGAVGFYIYSDCKAKKITGNEGSQQIRNCQLGMTPCNVELPGLHGQIYLDRQPKYLQPFGMTVSLQGSDADKVQGVTVSLNMTGMDMSLPVNKLHKTTTGDWRGELMVPVCSSGRSDWVVDVEIVLVNKRYVQRYGMKMW